MIAALVVTTLCAAAEPQAHVAQAAQGGDAVALEPLEGERATAATAAGASTFVGVVIGALGVPAAYGIGSFAGFQRGATPDELLVAATIGGTAGAAIGGFAGAATTTTWTGVAVVPAAAAGGALAGLLPATIFGRAVLVEGDESSNAALSISVFVAMALATGAAAGAAAYFAEPSDARVEASRSTTPSGE